MNAAEPLARHDRASLVWRKRLSRARLDCRPMTGRSAILPRLLATPFAAMFWLAVLILFSGLGQGDVRIDGAVYAWVAKWMVASGDWLSMYYDRGETPYFNKPPLQFWLMAATMKVFGPTTWAAKLITPVFGLATVCMTYAIARLGFSRAVAATAGIVLVTSYTYLRHASGVRLDPGVAFFVLVVLWAGLRMGVDADGALSRKREMWLWVLMGVACGLGMMLKSPVVLLALLIVAVAWAWGRRWDLLINWRWVIIVHVAAAIWGPWHVYMWQHWGERFTSIYFGREMAARLAEESLGAEPIWHYFEKVGTHYWPWLPVALAGLWLMGRRLKRGPASTQALTRGNRARQGAMVFVIVWVVVWFLAAHVATRRYERYLIPWYPAMGIAAAYAMVHTPIWGGWRKWVLPNLAVASMVTLLLIELSGISVRHTESPALQAALPMINAMGGEHRVFVAEPAGSNALCRTLFYLDESVPVTTGPNVEGAKPGDVVIARHGQSISVAVHELFRDRRVAVYRVVADDEVVAAR